MGVRLAGEGAVDLAIMRRLLEEAGLPIGPVVWGEGRNTGKDRMTERLPGWAAGATFGAAFFVLRDLDDDAPCAGALRAHLLPAAQPGLVLRIAVRAADSWLIADRERLAEALKVSPAALPAEPDACADPKAAIIAAARKSRSSLVRKGVPPRPESGRKQGEDYAETLIAFVREAWSPAEAALRSDSLRRAKAGLADLRLQLAQRRTL